MAISRVKTWSSGEVLTASDLNAEFNNILNNGADLVSPFTKAISMGGFALNFDAANTIAITAATNGASLTGGAFNTPQGADIVAAATLNLDTATGNSPDVTGNTGITAVTLSQGRQRLVRFTGTPTITNGASLVVEGGADFTAVAGQYVLFIGYASSVVRCVPFTTPAATQTLTNKTITGATISTSTLTNPSNTTQALTDAATTNWDASLGAIATWTMAASRTAAAPTNLKAGGYYILRLSMDGTGGWVVTWNSAFKGFSGGVMPQPVIVASATSQYEFTSDGTSLFLVGYSQLRAAPIAAGKNITCRTDASVPNTKLNINYDQLVLQDTNANALVVNSGALNIDFTTTGANALDTSTQQASTWYYGWVIAKPDGTVAALGSTSATAPTMPSGYVYKALMTAARSNGSTQFVKYRQFGNEIFYEGGVSVLASGAATVETAVSLTTVAPPIAQAVQINITKIGVVCDGSGNGVASHILRVISGTPFATYTIQVSIAANATFYIVGGGLWLPNISQNFYYLHSVSNGTSPVLSIDVVAFKLPMGGE